MTQAILHTDGGSRGNPGPSGIGYVLLADDGRGLVTLSEGGAFIGEATNNEAEYQALLWGLANAAALGIQHLSIRADSELMVKQIKGEYKVRSEGIKPLHALVMADLRMLKSYDISHVRRENNARADGLANEAMDVEWSIGTFEAPYSLVQSAVEKAQGKLQGEAEGQPGSTGQYPSAGHPSSGQYPSADKHPSLGKHPSGCYTLTVKDHFDAAHALIGYPGECRQLHGHTWDIEVSVSGSTLDEVGIVYDFKSLKADLAGILGRYDHVYLNDVPPFNKINATAEHLAREIYEQLEGLLPPHIDLEEVVVWESPIAKLTYRR